MTQIKIAITGVHGSGKSWKVKELSDRFSNIGNTIYVVKEVARSCPYKLGTIFAQKWIWHEQMVREKFAMKQDVDVILFDRTIIDNLTYYWAIIEDIDNPHDQDAYFTRWQKLYQEAKAWMPTYSQVIRLPLNLEYLKADDPIRSKDVEYARRIDKLFDRFVDPFVTHHGASSNE